MAKLHFKYGAMNSGKSDTLIKTAYNYQEQGLKVTVIKPSVDTKGGQLVTARAGGTWLADIMAGPELDIERAVLVLHKKSPINCILVDESQFLETDQIDQLFRLAKVADISVICYGLRTDFRQNLFTGSMRLFELADNIEKIPTMCRSGSQAEFNCRIVDGKVVFEGEQLAIDGENTVSYESLCGDCYLKELEKQEASKS